MLDINIIRENPDLVREAMRKRQINTNSIELVLNLDVKRRAKLKEVEKLKAEKNIITKQIGKIKDKSAQKEEITKMKIVSDEIAQIDKDIRNVEAELKDLLSSIPNIPDPRVPFGHSCNDNVVLRTEGEATEYDEKFLTHWDLGKKLNIIDFERGTKIAGSRFYVLNGAVARLQRALISFMLDLHIRQGYVERYVPFMVKSDILYGAGQLPKFKDNLYHDVEDNYWMVPTAEVPLTGLYMNEIIDEDKLPLRFTAYTPCFRKEKMSAGKDVKGIKRGHQFDKVEMYCYSHPDKSNDEFEYMLASAEETLKLLELPYRVISQCTGDLGFNAKICYDLEVWTPCAKEWLEVSSISNDGDFQSRRAGIRFRNNTTKKSQFLHTLNGSGLGLPRTMIAILETYQQPDRSVIVPEVLKPWMGGIERITKED